MTTVLPWLKALADESRLRIVRLLLVEPSLNVGEIAVILGLSQPNASQKLAALRKAGLVRERKEGGFAFYELAPARAGEHGLALLAGELKDAPDPHGDLARLAEVRRERAERAMLLGGADANGDGGALVEPGRSWVAWARALTLLVPPLRIADFGCGDGALTVEMARFAKSVVGVEMNGHRLNRARERAARLGMSNVAIRHERVEETRMRAGGMDLVVASHLLHHLVEPGAALRQAHRVLVSGGRVLVLELAPHREEWTREKLGHRWPGFSLANLEKLLADAGFERVAAEPISARGAAREPFRIHLATGVKP